MRHTQRVNGIFQRLQHITRRVQQFHIQYFAQVRRTPIVRPRHIRLEPHGLILEVAHVVEVQIDLLLLHHLGEVHCLLDVR